MLSADCLELFQQLRGDQDKAAKLANVAPRCQCEAHSVSPHSPGRVEYDEHLARLIYSPQHIDPETGKLTEYAFDDALNKGLSTVRRHYADAERIRALANAKVKADRARGHHDRKFEGVVEASVLRLRSAKTENDERSLCVYDTAEEDNLAHADVIVAIKGNKVYKKLVRKKLWQIFSATPIDP
jgi:hypothetical protein